MDHHQSRKSYSARPLKIITNLFSRNKNKSGSKAHNNNNNKALLDNEDNSLDCLSAGSTSRSTGDLELDALHISRRDNPYLQILNSRECLVQESPPPPAIPCYSSPTRSCDPLILSEIHTHLVRSPPPVSWPISPRSGTFSPTEYSSVDGLDSVYRRSQSEEHILGSRSANHSIMFSPARGATPDIVSSSPSYYGKSRFSNWRNMASSSGDDSLSPKYTPNDAGATMDFSVVDNEGYRRGNSSFSGTRSSSSTNPSQFYRSNRPSSVVRRDSYFRNQWRSKTDIKSMESLINDGGEGYYYSDRKSLSHKNFRPDVSSSPRLNKSFYFRKSITLRPKKGGGPTYMDIESQTLAQRSKR